MPFVAMDCVLKPLGNSNCCAHAGAQSKQHASSVKYHLFLFMNPVSFACAQATRRRSRVGYARSVSGNTQCEGGQVARDWLQEDTAGVNSNIARRLLICC